MSHLVEKRSVSRTRKNKADIKVVLETVLEKIKVLTINSDEITSIEELAKKYKKKDYEKLIGITYNMFETLLDLIKPIEEACSSLSISTTSTLHTPDTPQHDNLEIIKEIRRNRDEITSTILNLGCRLQDDLKNKTEVLADLKSDFGNKINIQTSTLQAESAQFKSYAEILGKNVAEMGKKVASKTQTKEVVKSLVTELKKNDRKTNVIVYGVEPQNCGKALFKDAFSDIGFRGLSFEIEPVGESKEGKLRPIRVRFAHESTVKILLRNAHMLKSVGYANMYMAPDRSYKERLAHTELIKKLKEKIAKDPSSKWGIRDGEIVKIVARS